MTGPAIDPLRPRDDPGLAKGRLRAKLVALGFAVLFLTIAGRLIDVASRDLRSGGDSPLASTTPSVDKSASRLRPDITDRHGTLLATDLRIPSVYANPTRLANTDRAADELARVLGQVDADRLKQRLTDAKAKGKKFVWIKHRVSPEEEERIRLLGLPGVWFKMVEHRVYPKARVASHVLGFVDLDNKGISGIERALDEGVLARARHANTLALSLDLRVQEVVRDELDAAVRRFRPKGACGLVQDIATGELLAFVSLPDFDPNQVDNPRSEGVKNRCTMGTYELGSLFKLLSHAMALESGRVRVNQRFEIPDRMRIGRHTIRDVHAAKRPLTVAEIFSHSSNVGTVQLTMAGGGAEPLRAFLTRLGLMDRSGIELFEVKRPTWPRKWSDVVTATVSYGHSIAVTPLQFVEAVGALVGDGTRAPATLIRRDVGPVSRTPPVVGRRTIEDLRYMMWLTVADGTATKARVAGYLLGGKTGTADKSGGRRGYRRASVLASFVGVFPLEAPRYVVLVMIDEPTGDKGTGGTRYGGQIAAPVVGAIVSRMGPLLGVRPSDPALETRYLDRLELLKASVAAYNREKAVAAVDTGR